MGLLDGIKVVEMSAYIAGPATAGMMCDWGAEVIKIEAPGGDAIRWNRPALYEGGWNPTFDQDNRGKRSIVIDYRKPEGAEVIRKLIADCDVFITSLRPRILKKAGLDYDSLAAWKPELIYASVTGYGLQGPAVDTPAFDITAFWARSGLAGMMTPPGGAPPYNRPGMGDHVTAISTTLGVMTALFARTRTGKGQLVESSLLRSGVYMVGYDLVDQDRRGVANPPGDRGRDGKLSAHFPAKDERWFCIWVHDIVHDWPVIYHAAGRADLAQDPQWLDADWRAANPNAVMDALDTGFRERSREDIGADLEAEGLIWSPVLSGAEVLTDPLVEAAGCFAQMDDGAGGTLRNAAPPVRLPGAERELKGPSFTPGQHTDAILAELGYGADAITAMRTAQAVG